jgi:hypothetical protein
VSRENVELVRSIYANWERGEFGVIGWANPDIEFVFDGGPSPGTWTGFAEIAEAMRDFMDAWSDFQSRPRSTASLTTNAFSSFRLWAGPEHAVAEVTKLVSDHMLLPDVADLAEECFKALASGDAAAID